MVHSYNLSTDGSKKLSANFCVREFRCLDGSDEILIDDALVALLQKIRSHYGKAVHINSAYRTKAYNAKQKGASPKSQHVYGKAADIWISGVSSKVLYSYICSINPSGGVGLYNTFVHLDVRGCNARWDYR